MRSGLEALKENRTLIHTFNNGNALIKYGENEEIIEQELKDFEWLKGQISIDFFYQLSSEDRIKLANILGVSLT